MRRKQSVWPWSLAIVVAIAGAATLIWAMQPSAAAELVVYKMPTCGCCRLWVNHARASGFTIRAVDVTDLSEIKKQHNIPLHLSACHTAVGSGYVFEGHIPADTIRRFLKERPAAAGLIVAGMPVGSPGMEGPTPQPYDILLLERDGRTRVYEHRGVR